MPEASELAAVRGAAVLFWLIAAGFGVYAFPAAAQPGLALEDVPEELVDLAPRALEVGKQVAGGSHQVRD